MPTAGANHCEAPARVERFRQLPKPLKLFLGTLVLLALMSLLDAAIGYRMRGRPALGNLWINQPAVDFYIYNLRVPHLHSPAFFTGPAFPWMYPAPSIFLYVPFYPGIRDTHWWPNYLAFLLVAASLDLWIALRLYKELARRGLARRPAALLPAAVLLLGWPFYFAFQRGNIELFLWVGVAAGVYCFARRRFTAAALLLGVCGSAKLYPLLLLGLFVRRRCLRFLFAGVAAAAATTLLALRYLEPDVLDAYRRINAGVRLWTELTTLKYWPTGVGPDHSFFGLLREVTAGAVLHIPNVLNIYLAVAGVAATAIFLLRVRRLPAVNQVLFLICAAILLPPTSFDYTLLQLLIPWGWVTLLCVDAAGDRVALRRFRMPMVLFGVALAPLTFLYTRGGVELYFAGPVRCVALVCLAVWAAWKPIAASTRQGLAGELCLPS